MGGYSADNRRADPHNLAVHMGGASAWGARGVGGLRKGVSVDQFGVPPLSWSDETTGDKVQADTVYASLASRNSNVAYSIERGPSSVSDGNGMAVQQLVGGGAQSSFPASLVPGRHPAMSSAPDLAPVLGSDAGTEGERGIGGVQGPAFSL